jgi:hypothetical protein
VNVSRINKVNKDHYTMAGRLTPDEIARERRRQTHLTVDRSSRSKPGTARDKSKRAKTPRT